MKVNLITRRNSSLNRFDFSLKSQPDRRTSCKRLSQPCRGGNGSLRGRRLTTKSEAIRLEHFGEKITMANIQRILKRER